MGINIWGGREKRERGKNNLNVVKRASPHSRRSRVSRVSWALRAVPTRSCRRRGQPAVNPARACRGPAASLPRARASQLWCGSVPSSRPCDEQPSRQGFANLEYARGAAQHRHQRSWREADLVFSGPGETKSRFRGQMLQAPGSVRDLSRRARCGCASANLGARVGADNSRTRRDSRRGRCNREQLFRSWWIHVAFSLEDDVETFWAAPTQLSGPGVSCFTRDRPPAADRQTRMAPISFVLSIWSRLHTPRLVSPSSVDYRDPGNLGRQSGHQPLVDELV